MCWMTDPAPIESWVNTWLAQKIAFLNSPADSPQIVTLLGSPPNLLIYHTLQRLRCQKNVMRTYMALYPLECELLINYAKQVSISFFTLENNPSDSRNPTFRAPESWTSWPGRKPKTPRRYGIKTTTTPSPASRTKSLPSNIVALPTWYPPLWIDGMNVASWQMRAKSRTRGSKRRQVSLLCSMLV